MADGYIEDRMAEHGRKKFKPFKPPKWWVEKQAVKAGRAQAEQDIAAGGREARQQIAKGGEEARHDIEYEQ